METTHETNGSTQHAAAIMQNAALMQGGHTNSGLLDSAKATLIRLDAVEAEAKTAREGATAVLYAILDVATTLAKRLELGTEVGILQGGATVVSTGVKAERTAAPKAKAASVNRGIKGGRKPAKVKAVAAPKATKEKPAKAPTERLARRSAEDIQAGVDRIVALLQSKPALRSEQITAELGLDKRETPGLLKAALKANAISFTGRKRATQYFAR